MSMWVMLVYQELKIIVKRNFPLRGFCPNRHIRLEGSKTPPFNESHEHPPFQREGEGGSGVRFLAQRVAIVQNDFKMKLVPAFIAVFLLCGCSKEVALENQAWTYDTGVCSVTFTLKNHGDSEVRRNVRIVAHKLKNIAEGAIVNDIIGEKIIVVKLRPYEEKEIDGGSGSVSEEKTGHGCGEPL